MKRHLPSLAAAFSIITISPVEAIPVYGTFTGAVTGTSGTLISYAIGTPVTGSFSYDLAIPSRTFLVNIDGQPFAGYSTWSGFGLWFGVDANGLPTLGTAAGLWDLYIGNGGYLGLSTFGNNSISAQVTYQITGVPDAGATSFLLGVAMVSVAITRRFIR